MVAYDADLLDAAQRLLFRRAGQRGKLPGARIRRSISTCYYALFHFLLDEVGLKIVGTGNDLRVRRRILARTISHRGAKTTLDKLRGSRIDSSVEEFLRFAPRAPGPVVPPPFVADLAGTFADAQAKRHDADYDMNKVFGEVDAKLLQLRVKEVIEAWRRADTPADRDFKHAVCILLLLKGQLRPEP